MAALIKIHITQWFLNGQRVKPRTPGAMKKRIKSKKWYGIGIPGMPAKARVPLCESKTVALQMLAEKCRQGERGELGLTDPTATQRQRPIAEHIDDFENWLTAAGRTVRHVRQQVGRIRRVCAECRFTTPEQFDQQRFAQWLLDRRQSDDLSIQTANYYAQAMHQFGQWLVQHKRLHRNPFTDAPKGNPATDRRRRRRAFTPQEFARLLAATRSSPEVHYLLSGEDRYHLYRVAYYTGFRAAALASLTPRSFALEVTPPTVTLATTSNKSRKLKVNAIPTDLAEELKCFLQDRDPDQPIWGHSSAMQHAAKILRHDLAAAKIPAVVIGPEGAETLDFHAIRHTTATELTRGDIRTAQEILGHSTPVLTARYAHRNLQDQAEAIKRLG